MKYPINEWRRLYEEKGWSTVEIGEKYDVNDNTVSKYLKQTGVEVPQPKYRHLVDEWVWLYTQEHQTLEEIATRCDKSVATISKYLKNEGVEISSKRLDHLADEWADLYNEGRNTYQIANQYDASPASVQKYLRKRNDVELINTGPDPEFEHLLDDWIKLYREENLLVKEIAERYEAAAPTICHYLNDAGVDTGITKDYPVKKWVELYKEEHMSTRQIAQEYGCGKTVVAERLKEKGVDVIPYGKNKLSRSLMLSRIDQSGQCWEWTGNISAHGYGLICIESKNRRAHRVTYRLWKGEIPEEHLVRHKCDNRSCVYPKHLETGTPSDNMQDVTQIQKDLTELSSQQIKDILKTDDPWHELAEEHDVRIAVIRALKL
jgi:DNA-binding transcriptional regulator LsrR (DeoR family)